MRQFPRIAWLLLVIVLVITATAESPRSLYNKGQQAEARQDYITAFEAYRQAYDQKPTELKYRIAFQRTRFLASAAHVNKGQELREQGKLDEALAEFEYATKVDPSSFIAVQEMRRTKTLIDSKSGTQPAPPPSPSPISRRLEEAAGPAELAPVSNQPVTLEISNDSKFVYETLGKLAGVNVLFDPDYTPRRVTLKLNGVSLQEALDILAFHSNTFWRPITPNTIFVAANTPAKRKELEQQVLKTFYLTNVSAATDLQDITSALRGILEMQKIQQVNSQNAIIVRGTPDQVALAEKIIGDIDKAKPEVIVEVAVLQVRRDKMRDLGIKPPASATVTLTGPTTTTTTPSTTPGATPTTTPTGNLTLNNFPNLKATDFAVTIPSATANFLYNDSDTKLIQNPQIRATDGIKASLKIGDRVPIATGSIGNPIGGGFNASAGLVNTQFQYIDVGVNIDITPRVFQGREIGLKLVLDISSVTGSSNIGGITQPIISQRKSEQDIRLKEGEINLLGGIFEQTDTKSISGIPGLAQLPFLKYFFSSEHKEKIDSEIIFILIPHIVRGQDYSELNHRAIDVGTGNGIDLRRVSRPSSNTPATSAPQTPVPLSQRPPAPAAQPPAQPATQSTPQTTGQTSGQSPNQIASAATEAPPANGAAAAANANTPSNAVTPMSLRFDPPSIAPNAGSTFTMNVMMAGGKDIYSAPMQIIYDPNLLQLVNVSNGDFLSRDGQAVALVHREDLGTIQANATRPPGSGGVSGDGILYALTFQAKAKGQANVSIRANVKNSAMQTVPAAVSSGVITIK
ncbi:MAG: type and secretion system protein [Acidobacteriales bacterium]|nr:type and secretion system protein [Terriglobales bacterium]